MTPDDDNFFDAHMRVTPLKLTPEDADEETTVAGVVEPQLGATRENNAPPLKGQIEAALFITNHPLTAIEIAELVRADLEETEEALMELMNDYAFRDGCALEIDDTDGYILQIRDEYRRVSDTMLPMELTHGALQTLSAIAIKGPLIQSALVEMRGSTVYDHIPELVAKKLVNKKRAGRSYKLSVTPAFYEYFKLRGDKKELEVMMALMDRYGGGDASAVAPAGVEVGGEDREAVSEKAILSKAFGATAATEDIFYDPTNTVEVADG